VRVGRDRCGVAGALAACGLLVLLARTDIGADAPAGAATMTTASLGEVVIPDLGLGYTVSSEGPLNPSEFASNAPDPSAAAGALSTLSASIATYERVWQADGGLNQVQDLLVRFPSKEAALVFLQAAQHALESGEIVDSNAVPSIPGARRVTYFAATNQDGVGEAITMRAGVYVDLLSFFSAASGNAQPISPANAEKVARAQYAAMRQAPGGASAQSETDSKKGISAGTIALAVVVVLVLSLAVATPALLRRRRDTAEAAVAAAPLPAAAASDRDAVDDLREHSG